MSRESLGDGHMEAKITNSTVVRCLNTGVMLIALVGALAVSSSGCEFGTTTAPESDDIELIFTVLDEQDENCEDLARIAWVLRAVVGEGLAEVVAGAVPGMPFASSDPDTPGCVYTATIQIPEHPHSHPNKLWVARAFDEESWVADCPEQFQLPSTAPAPSVTVTFRRFEPGCTGSPPEL